MKLITKTGLNFILVSTIFFLLGSMIMYYAVRVILAEDLNDRLVQMQVYFEQDALGVNDLEVLASPQILIAPTTVNIPASFIDTAVIENESYVLYKKLAFSHYHKGNLYKVAILQSQTQTDLLIMKFVILNVGMAMLFFIIVFLVNYQSVKSALRVLYSTIMKLENFDDTKEELHLDEAETEELQKLNEVFVNMSNKIKQDFEDQKEYTENVSHELQTPLAIISSKADELLQSDNLTEAQMQQLAMIVDTTNRLAKINQALIFLTKIDNRFYTEESTFDINSLIKEKLALFKEAIVDKQLTLKLNLEDITHVYMNQYLAETLILNLIKNAVVHNTDGGELEISLANKTLVIANSGAALSFPSEDIFKRFSRNESSKKSLGIGLSIVSRICKVYKLGLTYQFTDKHIITIKF